MPLCYDDEFRVYQFECDPWDRMTPGAVLRRVQEIGTMQCESLGIDEALYRRTHTVFLLSRLSLRYFRAPAIEQTVHIQTRAYGQRKATYHRVTSLHDAASGEKLCETDSRWILVDTETRRILRRPLEEFVPYFSEEPGEEHDFAAPRAGADLPLLAQKRAGYSLCDRNGHVNNTCYADMMCDALPLERLKAGPPVRMLLHYRTEIPLGSDFALHGAPAGERAWHFVANTAESKNFDGYVEFSD